MINRHRKGADGERDVRDYLQDWWAQAEPKTKFNRAPLSGGWHAASDQQTAGDLLVTPGSKFPWSVEVKRHENWSPKRFLDGFASPVWAWWAQAIRDAKSIEKQPMLWARRSKGNWFVVLPLAQITETVGALSPRFRWHASNLVVRRGVEVIPAAYFAADLLRTDPRIWI
jgi:hypothetical protein